MTFQITLEQWRSLLAVVDAGGYAHAGKLKTPSEAVWQNAFC